MNNLTSKIEAVMFFKNEPLTHRELSKILNCDIKEIEVAINDLQEIYKDRGIIIINTGEEISFGTHPEHSSMIETLQKEELSRDLGRAGLETLTIILYKGPISRREIDYIRGVNSGFILRNLLIRGLIERAESITGERSFSYKPTLALFEYLGLSKKEDLPEFESAFKKLEDFSKTREDEETNEKN
jgi:Predicted transcriptional regulator containing the HTH domain